MGSGINKADLETSVYDVLVEGAAISEAAVFAEESGYHVVGANVDLTAAELDPDGFRAPRISVKGRSCAQP